MACSLWWVPASNSPPHILHGHNRRRNMTFTYAFRNGRAISGWPDTTPNRIRSRPQFLPLLGACSRPSDRAGASSIDQGDRDGGRGQLEDVVPGVDDLTDLRLLRKQDGSRGCCTSSGEHGPEAR